MKGGSVFVGGGVQAYIHFSVDDVDETPQNNDEIKDVPRIPKVILKQKEDIIQRLFRNLFN